MMKVLARPAEPSNTAAPAKRDVSIQLPYSPLMTRALVMLA